MFTTYKKHNNELYNNLVKLSRNKFFYNEIRLEDKVENRILLIFFHFALILYVSKGKYNKDQSQNIFDNIFQNIEYTMREMGDGDVAVNKKMKNLSRIFYDILITIEKNNLNSLNEKSHLIKKYFVNNQNKTQVNCDKLNGYFTHFKNFCLI